MGNYTVSSTANLTGIGFLLNGAIENRIPIPLALADVLEVEATVGAGGGYLIFDIS